MKLGSIATQIVFVVAVVALVAALAYLPSRKGGEQGAQLPAAVTDPMASHHGGSSAPLVYADLQTWVGKPAPEFSLADSNGNVYSSQNLRGKNVILFFNEGLMCYPACWQQIAAFPKDVELQKEDAVVLSVVVDAADDWQAANAKMPELAAATVVFDADKSVSWKFGMLNTASSMHYGSLPGHTYVVIDKAGIVRHVFDDLNMAIHNRELAAVIANL